MPAQILPLADPPAEELDSLKPVCQHTSKWRPRRAIKRHRKPLRHQCPPLPLVASVPSSASNTLPDSLLESRVGQLEEIVRDCALLLRSGVNGRLDEVEKALSDEAARLDERLHHEARRRCHLLAEITEKVSAAIDQLRREARSPRVTTPG